MIRLVAAALAALPLVALGQEAAPQPAPAAAPARAPVSIGLGAGFAGSGEMGEGGTAFRIRIGAPRSPRLELAFEGGLDVEGGLTRTFYDVAATLFPWRRVLFLRGGVGLSTSVRQSTDVRQGVNLLAGVGAALGAARGLNVTVNLETMVHWYQNQTSDFAQTGSVAAWLGLEWL